MALITADRVLETSTTTSTGAYSLAGAVTGYRAASTVCANGDTFYYYAEDVNANGVPTGGWETGLGTWNTGNTLTRTTIHSSSNANAAVSWTAGTRRIALGITSTFFGTKANTDSPTFTGTIAVSGSTNFNNNVVSSIKTATFNSQTTIATTTGSITVDWTTAQNQKQTEPTGAIAYTFTAPPGPCHLQLLVDSDGTSTAQTFTWPGTVIWLGATWTGVANKKAIINFWYDGTNYYAIGTNQV